MIFTKATLIGANTNPNVYHKMTGSERGTSGHVMSRSSLADFIACPAKWVRGLPSKETTATKWGSLLDTLVLSPDQLPLRYAVYPDTYPCEPTAKDPRTEKPWNNNSTHCKEWKAEREGMSFIHREKTDDDGSPDEDSKVATLGNANRAVTRLMEDARMASLIKVSSTQVMVTAEFQDKATGIAVPFKTLLDMVPDVEHEEWGKCLGDFKTARDASEREFTKAIHSGFYDWQAAIYRDAYVKATGEDRTDFLFAVQENTPPYQPALWSIGSDWLDEAGREVVEALKFYCHCVSNKDWPGYQISTAILSWGSLSREAWMQRQMPRIEAVRELKPETDLHRDELVP